MQASDFVEVLCAAHLGNMVEGPFSDRGGMMVVGPPGVLKTTFVSVLDAQYHDVVMLSDINVKSLIRLRDSIATGKINTLVLPELAKVYERVDSTAQGVEGTIRALVAEGFSSASFEDARINRLKARCMVIGALTPAMLDQHFERWVDTGFSRRFLWCLVRLSDTSALEKAAVNWKRIDFRVKHVPRVPLGDSIPNLTTKQERERIVALVKYQPSDDHSMHIQLLTRICAVLRWWYAETNDPRSAMDTIEAFAPALGRDGAVIDLPSTKADNSQAAEVTLAAGNAARQLAAKRWEGKKRRKKVGKK
jgi:hypothetical protein